MRVAGAFEASQPTDAPEAGAADATGAAAPAEELDFELLLHAVASSAIVVMAKTATDNFR
ncbi:MAG: hypothetical protein NVS3B21_28250 [Acidimicrobiales bacterium]